MQIKMTKDPLCANAITHGGTFHADEVMATVILGKIFEDITMCRVSRMPEDYNKEAFVYDIGGGAFDHHQMGGNGVRENGVPYAAVGLIWKEFGHRLTNASPDPEGVWMRVDQDLIQGIDAVDNGVMPQAEYPVQCMNLPLLISLQNPNWDDDLSADAAFLNAVRLAETVFDSVLSNAISRANAQSFVEAAISQSENHIMVLERFVPWQECLFGSSNALAKEIHYVIYPSNRGGYNWQCVPDVLHGFGQRKPTPAGWWGASSDELQRMTKVKTAIFCHPSGFIGGAQTFEDAYALAKLAENDGDAPRFA